MPDTTNTYSPTLVQTACRWLYSCILALIVPLAFIKLASKAMLSSDKDGPRQLSRFGIIPAPNKTGGYLFHCVSVGEVVAASCLIKRLMEQEPDAQITITTTTATGSARVEAIFGDQVHHFYLPFDLHVTMAGMLRRIRPKAVLITEVELWPNLIHACWKRAIPTFVINARMTDRSMAGYRKISALFTPMLCKLNHICAQGERDYQNYLALGINPKKLTLTNNVKFDQVAAFCDEELPQFLNLRAGQRPVIVAGSTHDPEEEVMLDTLQQLLPEHASMLLIVVPRHPERFNVVRKLIQQRKLNFVQSSQSRHIPDDCQVVLVDEMGKLNQAYQVASVAFVGGSLSDRGGHNALEPAAMSVPVIMGPHIYNNPVICSYLEEQGALFVAPDAQAVTNQCAKWLSDPEQASTAGRAGRAVLDTNRGAVDKTLATLRVALD